MIWYEKISLYSRINTIFGVSQSVKKWRSGRLSRPPRYRLHPIHLVPPSVQSPPVIINSQEVKNHICFRANNRQHLSLTQHVRACQNRSQTVREEENRCQAVSVPFPTTHIVKKTKNGNKSSSGSPPSIGLRGVLSVQMHLPVLAQVIAAQEQPAAHPALELLLTCKSLSISFFDHFTSIWS